MYPFWRFFFRKVGVSQSGQTVTGGSSKLRQNSNLVSQRSQWYEYNGILRDLPVSGRNLALRRANFAGCNLAGCQFRFEYGGGLAP